MQQTSLIPSDGSLPPPAEGVVDLLIIAGEHSGDAHSALMVRELLERHPELKVCAMGGRHLAAAGAQLLFDLSQHSVVGLAEVIRNYGFFRSIFNRTLAWIEQWRPKAIVFVDYPGFNLRMAAALAKRGISRKGGGNVSVGYYISPQVWAWKARRRFKMAKVLDSLAVIFPFEADVFADTDLSTVFVGHPFVSEHADLPYRYEQGGPLLLLPGSRMAAVKRIFPIQLQTLAELRRAMPELQAVVPYASDALRELIADMVFTSGLSEAVSVLPSWEGFSAGAVLTSSGTASLQVALAGIPGAIVYRAHPLTWLVGKSVVRIQWLGIANILLNRDAWPEYLQGRARPADLAAVIADALRDPVRRRDAAASADELRSALSQPGDRSAAEWTAELIGTVSG